MRRPTGVTPKLTMVLVFFAAALLGALGALAYANSSAALEAAARAEMLTRALDRETELELWSDERLSRISALASSHGVIQSTAALSSSVPGTAGFRVAHDQLVRELAPAAQLDQPFLSLFVLEPREAQVVAATDPLEEGKYKETLEYFIQGRSGPYVQNVYYSTVLQGPAMTVSAPIRAANGRLLGVLAGRLDLQELNAMLARRPGVRRTDEAFLVNASSLFVTQPRLAPDSAVLLRGVHTEAVNRCLERNSGVIAALDYRDVPSIIAYRWLSEPRLCLIVKMDRAEALAPARDLGQSLALAGGLVLGAATLLAFLLARAVTRPVLALARGAEEIGQGNLEVRVDLKSDDELGQLGRTFDAMAEKLSHSRRALEASNRELEAFSYSVSHDLRAPLRAIDGFSRILLEEYGSALPADATRYLELVRSNTQTMGELVDDLLGFSRLNQQPLNKVTVAPAQVARLAWETLQADQDGRQIDLTIRDLPDCEADPAMLKHVYLNLLGNALKFTRRRPVTRIEAGWQEQDGLPVYFVRDNGVGFDMRYAEKLFGVFQRLHRAEEYEGTGVGLAIVQRIVSRHGGRAWAESELEHSATFFFTLSGGPS